MVSRIIGRMPGASRIVSSTDLREDEFARKGVDEDNRIGDRERTGIETVLAVIRVL